MVQTLGIGDQGEQVEDEEMKNEVTQDDIFANGPAVQETYRKRQRQRKEVSMLELW